MQEEQPQPEETPLENLQPEVAQQEQAQPEKNIRNNPNKYDMRFVILFSLSALISIYFFIASFRTHYLCFDTCGAGDIQSIVTTIKMIMVFTVLPTILCLYISVRPLFLIKKTTFSKKIKQSLIIISAVLLFNTVVTPTAIIMETRHKSEAKQNEESLYRTNRCLDGLVNFNTDVDTAKSLDPENDNMDNPLIEDRYRRWGAYMSRKKYDISKISNESYRDFYYENEDVAYRELHLKECLEFIENDRVNLTEEYNKYMNFCKKFPSDTHFCTEYKYVLKELDGSN